MAKVFTITEGLENLGALKSGGQGSVYKARRSGEIITAIKILPTPISSESDDDKNFTSFQNEVQKLKRVNESPNPNVVSIIASGITNSGNLPYIEMDYIEGPDLAELLKPPHDSIFNIKEIIKVADHLSNALAHCHRADVKHGDIKSNNVKFNQRTGNYILLDFGLSIMSDEQRRTSIRHAGAIEFMAPEQSAGEMFFETDIYSFGIILFELLAGTVPFPLFNKGEMARNAVMVSHMEAPLPDILSLRRQAMPNTWNDNKKERQMLVPFWLIEMIHKCLEKIPANRFKNGNELQDFIHSGIIAEESKKVMAISPVSLAMVNMDETALKKQYDKLELQSLEKDSLIKELEYEVEIKDKELYQLRYAQYDLPKPKATSGTGFFIVLILLLALAGFNIYGSFIKPYMDSRADTTTRVNGNRNAGIDTSTIPKTKVPKKVRNKTKKIVNAPVDKEGTDTSDKIQSGTDYTPGKKYRIVGTAYFHDTPSENGWRDEYVTTSNAVFTALEERNEFIYVKFTNSEGSVTQGWLLKKKLTRL